MEFPIYKVVIDSDELGIDKISLVAFPAVECNFLAFSKGQKQVLLSVNDEEQRIITGVVARAEYPIYRNDNGYEYYITFDSDVIKEMAIKLLADNHQNEVNIEHKANSDVDGVQMLEMYIKDSKKGINPKGFEDISDGSLFATYKVFNEDVWKAIKEGKFNGFSLEGMFNLEQNNEEDKALNEIMEMLDEIEQIINNKSK